MSERSTARRERLTAALAKARAQKRKRSLSAAEREDLADRIGAYEDELALLEADDAAGDDE